MTTGDSRRGGPTKGKTGVDKKEGVLLKIGKGVVVGDQPTRSIRFYYQF